MRSRKDKNDPEAVQARQRVLTIIDSVKPEDLIMSIKRAPSLRGMILGYIAEEMFDKHIRSVSTEITEVAKHDDHDRSRNKSDRTFIYRGKSYSVQLKSMQTNSISRDINSGRLVADVQNDGSDARRIHLPNGNYVQTTCYQRGEYDFLAVPLFPFTGDWSFAYMRNRDCRLTVSKKYNIEDREYLLASTEQITWPLDGKWTTDLFSLIQ
ncbi:MAG: hypothetical protein HZC25_18060 [Rhodospirillales bacterium]|nr:hypothetical protein [Rhodospirillales bacterium]